MKANEKRLSANPPVVSRALPTTGSQKNSRRKSSLALVGSLQPTISNPQLNPSLPLQKEGVGNLNISQEQLRQQLYQVMPKPGRSIPKLRVEDLGVGAPISHNSLPMNNSASVPSSRVHLGRVIPKMPSPAQKDMLTRFDAAIANPNPRVAQIKSTKFKRHLQNEIDQKLTNPEGFMPDAEKMKQKFIGDIASELGFGYDHLKTTLKDVDLVSPRQLGLKMDTARLNSWNAKSNNSLLKEWSKDTGANDSWTLPPENERRLSESNANVVNATNASRGSSGSVPRIKQNLLPVGKPRRMANSEQKLSEISEDFRQSLLPYANRDTRELIRTPTDDLMKELSDQHARAVKQREYENEMGRMGTQTSTNRSGGSGANSRLLKPSKNIPSKVASGNLDTMPVKGNPFKGKVSQSADVSRVGSRNQDLSGIMDFRSLLEIQSGKIKPPTQKQVLDVVPLMRNNSLNCSWKMLEEMPPLDMIPGSKIHGQLKNSVKSIDEAARVAQTLGTLMSKVAILNSNTNQVSTGTDALSPSDRKMNQMSQRNQKPQKNYNPYEPISNDIQLRASQLTDLAGEAQRGLKSNSDIWGFGPEKKGVTSAGSSAGTMTNTSTSTGMETQTESIASETGTPKVQKEFEFVPEMSYTDQLMLKRLREAQSRWRADL